MVKVNFSDEDLRNIVKGLLDEVDGAGREEKSMINEMATMNGRDVAGSIPRNRYSIEIHSNDHAPAHFHLIKPDGFDLRFSIETGEFLGENWAKEGYNVPCLTSIVQEWLNQPSTAVDFGELTNKLMCTLQWNIFHP